MDRRQSLKLIGAAAGITATGTLPNIVSAAKTSRLSHVEVGSFMIINPVGLFINFKEDEAIKWNDTRARIAYRIFNNDLSSIHWPEHWEQLGTGYLWVMNVKLQTLDLIVTGRSFAEMPFTNCELTDNTGDWRICLNGTWWISRRGSSIHSFWPMSEFDKPIFHLRFTGFVQDEHQRR